MGLPAPATTGESADTTPGQQKLYWNLMLMKNKKFSTNYELRKVKTDENDDQTFQFMKVKRGKKLFKFTLVRFQSYKSCPKTGLMSVLLKIKRKSISWKGRAANRWLLLDDQGKQFLTYCFDKVDKIKKLKHSHISQQLKKSLTPSENQIVEDENNHKYYTVKTRKNSRGGLSWSYEVRNI